MPKISVFILSHNKNGFVQEAIASVMDQAFTDFELWIVENSTDVVTRDALREYLFSDGHDPRVIYSEIEVPAAVRRSMYAPCWLLNNYYPQAQGEIILYLSDDDLFMPGLFGAVAYFFEEHPEHSAMYFDLARTNAPAPGHGTDWNSRFAGIGADIPRGYGQVDCQIDACQIAYRTSVLETIGQPYFYEPLDGSSGHADGIHLQKIAGHYTFMPVSVPGVIHRHTPISTWSKM